MGVEAPAAMMQRALGDDGFAMFQRERGVADTYTLTAVQADAILRMTLGQFVNLEQEKLGGEHAEAARGDRRVPAHPVRRQEHPGDHPRRSAWRSRRKYGDERRTEISGEEIGSDRSGRPDHRRDDGRHDQPQRLHQAHAGQRLSGPAPRRQGHQRRRRPRKKIRSSTCSSPARTTTCCSSPTTARSTGRRSTTCRS